MDFAGYQYYKLHHILLSSIGLWSSNNLIVDWLGRIFCTLLLASSLFIQLAVYFTNPYTLQQLLHALPYITFAFMFNLKYYAFYLNFKRVKLFFERIRDDWRALKTEEEFKIIHKYTYAGKVITIMFAASIYLSIIIIIISPLFPRLLDYIAPLNESRVYVLPVATEYFFDQKKYFTVVLVHIDILAIIGCTTIISTEMILFMFVQHVCGIFKIVSYRVECAMSKNHSLTYAMEKSSSYWKLIEAIELHKKAIEFVDLLKSSINISYSLLLLIGVAAVSLNLYRFSQTILLANNIEELSNVVFLLAAQFTYVYMGNYAGQLIVDHSSEVFQNAYDTKWYEAPVDAQKALLLLMVRSMKSCYLILGNMYVPCLQGFSMLSNISFSYFMVLYSTQAQ